jgi:hypothetical protein
MDASRRSLIRIAAVVAVATLAVVRSTSAAPITWMFTGPVDSTESPWTDILPLGTPATLTISWEPSTPQISPGCPPGSGLYPAVTEATLSVLNYSVPFGGRAIEVSAPNGNCSAHDFGVVFNMAVGPHTPPFLGAFDEIHAVVFPTNRFGANLSAILAPVENGVIFVQHPFFTSFRFRAPLEVLTPVPEPATMVLFGSGLAVALGAARAKRKARD